MTFQQEQISHLEEEVVRPCLMPNPRRAGRMISNL